MLREETVEPGTLELLKKIISIPELSEFRLVGGTALSLLLGHRKSIDLDLFTDKQYIKEILEDHFFPVSVRESPSKNIMQCNIQQVKVDFVSVRDPFIHPIEYIDHIPLAHIEDICALKLNAIKGRGSKKDFWDVAKLLQIYSLENLLKFYLKRYPYDDTFAVIRSLIYFEDAEDEADPMHIEKTTWQQVKQIIEKAFKENYNQN
ncbi:MAG: nucleotidyl transferase AbiEii/AbiGii toxin family protein [Sphingobacteriaceae bacterium]|nr:nucleotidyl transferase AbiEii/AbiGii toxin family protein [Sphingobacteriaceae bacterium]